MPGKGPPPKPTALRVLEGNLGHVTINKNEPKYRSEIPDRPSGMSAGAKKFWDEYVGIMNQSGVLTAADSRALATLCEDQSVLKDLRAGLYQMVRDMRKTLATAAKRFKELSERAKREGRTLTQEELALGKKYPTPMAAIGRTLEGRRMLSSMSTLNLQIMNREKEFGLMPGSRSRVEVVPGIGPRRMDSIEAALCG